jgi:hypothetical protein
MPFVSSESQCSVASLREHLKGEPSGDEWVAFSTVRALTIVFCVYRPAQAGLGGSLTIMAR